MSIRRPRVRPSWELIAVGAILVLYLAANAAIIWRRPAMMRDAVASVDSLLDHDRRLVDADLLRWRQRMVDDGRWVAGVLDVILDAQTASRDGRLDAATLARLATLTRSQIPAARVWVFDGQGSVLGGIDADTPTARHRWLALMSLRRDSSVIAATEARGRDLRLSVASPVHNRRFGDLAVILDVPAAEQLMRTVPRLARQARSGRAAVTFPYEAGFVAVTWNGKADDPHIDWPKTGWALTDSSLIVVGGTLSDTTPRFELAIPRAAARSLAETRIAWMHATAALIALPLCVVVLLVGRAGRNARLSAAEKSLAASQLRAAQAETAATRAGLAAISARLNPHFLSNAMHSVSALISAEPAAAEEALDRIGDLFRYSLEHSERHSVRLDEEWRFVKDYLAVEQMRLGRRLSVVMEIDPSVADCDVPAFVLQPLVENAVKHGISPRPSGGTVTVRARGVGDRIELEVSDDGRGAEPSGVQASAGTGLRTLTQRLELDARFAGEVAVTTAPGRGFHVRVTLTSLPEYSGTGPA